MNEFEYLNALIDKEFYYEGDPIICQLHAILDKDKSNHNCIACNIAFNIDLLKEHINTIKLNENTGYLYSSTILMLYLIVEKLFALFKSLEESGIKPSGYKSSFSTMRLIWAWANFFKHPKAFMYVHEPIFIPISSHEVASERNTSDPILLENKIIDDEFILKYYTGKEKNEELYIQLLNKHEPIVLLPDIIELFKLFKVEFLLFLDDAKTNTKIIDHLHDKATLIGLWKDEDE
ncbi:MAG: hypothetical protein IPQ02_20430 [Saprospiraceae bacterium]|nr:hypothetical protein [Candidatus Defluviibacterium haderslevense]